MKAKDNNMLLLAAAGLVGGLVFVLTRKKKEDTFYPNAEPTTAPVASLPATTTHQAPKPVVTLNNNLVLKKGSKGEEVKKLQQLLGITADGIFGSQTEAALLAKKGVKEVTLAKYPTLLDVNPNPLKVGDRVMVVAKPSLTVNEAGKMADGTRYDSGEEYDTYQYGEEIGKITALSSSKNFYVVQVSGVFGSSYVWVPAGKVAKI